MKLTVVLMLAFAGARAFACSATSFAGKDYGTGDTVTIDPKKNAKGTVVLFISAKCPCSRSHEPGMSALAKDFPEFAFVGVHSNGDEPEDLSGFYFKEAKLGFPVIRDFNAKIADDFKALKTPHAFVIGPKGECLYNGGVDDSKDAAKATQNYLRLALTDIKAGREPKEKMTRTLGCVIKR